MRVQRKARFVIRSIRRLEMIEQQERIEIIERPRADASLEPDTGALDNGLRFEDS
jgi:hypothetical protein